ncbi:hypothetical protein CHS0354_019845 [Potamilus streckersoni]|uniref:DBB domain-containing protein n=1 Tax=Potamilus streckersoni TaxID=2493646 RepID=A0AAE0SZ10_9BIVA|nr:hypothetical protein CHS0354_019845 [Potamilus streckersoni]
MENTHKYIRQKVNKVPTPGMMLPVHKEISVYYHPQDAADWAKYLQTKLGEREYQIATVLNDITSGPIFKGKTRVNVFLISPSFLELTDMNIMAGFDSHFSLALLMGVDIDDFTFMTTKYDVYEHVKEWVKFEVQESEESVRTLLMTIVSMYETDPDSFSPYDVLPPRIRPLNDVKNIIQEVTDQGVNIYIGLQSKVDSDVYIKFDGAEVDVKATFLKSHFYSFKLSDEMAQACSTFKVMCNNQLLGQGQLDDCAPSPQRTKDDFDMTQFKSALVLESRERSKDIVATGSSLDKPTDKQAKLDQIRMILEEETNPISLLCQCMALHGSDRGRLDKILADKIVASAPPGHLSLAERPERLSQIQSDQKWPSLLHFAAEYNLIYFAEALLMQPAFEGTCFIKNCDGRTPEDIAKHAGHLELSEMFSIYSQLLLNSCGGSHDSGYRGSGNKAPRLSQLRRFAEYRDSSSASVTSLPPPAPHGNSYVDASGYSKPPKPRPLHASRASSLRDSGLDNPTDNIIEEHIELEDMEEQSVFLNDPEGLEVSAGDREVGQGIIPINNTLRDGGSKIFFAHENPEVDGKRRSVMSKIKSEGDIVTTRRQSEGISPPFPSLIDIGKTYSDFEEFGYDRRPSIDSGREADDRSHHKEKAKKEKRSIFNFMKKRRRAKSEPFPSVEGGIVYKRQITNDDRQSNISTSSSGSSYSETSEHDQDAVTPRIREETKDKSKKKIKLFLKNAEKRKSVRLCHAMGETNMMYPSLPPKKSTFPDEVI